MPVGDDAAGAAHDGHKRGDIPRVHDRVAHDVGASAGEQEITVAVAPGAHETGAGGERRVGRAVLIFGRIKRIARQESGGFDFFARAHADGAAVERGRMTVADHEFTQHRLMNRPEHRLAEVQECDERAPKRNAGDEGFGAIDWIKHPHEFSIGAGVGKLFANDSVFGKARGDEIAHEFLRAAVGGGDGGIVGFYLNLEGRVGETRKKEIAAFLGELGQKRAVRREIHGKG